jgi:hypothetical protein
MYINSHLSPCVCTQSPKYLEMAQGHISLSRTQPQACRRGCPGIFGKGVRAPPKHQWTRPRSRLRSGCTADTNGHPVPDGCPLGRSGLRRTGGVGTMLRRRRSCRKKHLWQNLFIRNTEATAHEASIF